MTQEQVISNYIRFRLEGLKKKSQHKILIEFYYIAGHGVIIRVSRRGKWYIQRHFWNEISKSFNLSLKETKNIFNYYIMENLGAKNPDCIYM